MSSNDINIENLGNLSAKLHRLQNIDPKLMAGMKQAMEIVRNQAIVLVPVNHGELRGSIHTKVELIDDGIRGKVYTNKDYSVYVELGTGPIGAGNHEGISPNVHPTYRGDSWWIPGDKVDPVDAERYHWPKFTNKAGKTFYLTSGQPAQPYMYPAMKMKETEAVQRLIKSVDDAHAKLAKGK